MKRSHVVAILAALLEAPTGGIDDDYTVRHKALTNANQLLTLAEGEFPQEKEIDADLIGPTLGMAEAILGARAALSKITAEALYNAWADGVAEAGGVERDPEETWANQDDIERAGWEAVLALVQGRRNA